MDVAPWQLDQLSTLWDSLSKPLGFRCFTLGKAGSKPRACRRLAVILDKHHTTFEELEANLTAALIYLQQHGVERCKQVTGSELNARLTFWRFIDPPDNLVALADLATGRTPAVADQDKARRDRKAQLLQEFQQHITEWVAFMAYRSGDDNDALQAALNAARHALATAEDTLNG